MQSRRPTQRLTLAIATLLALTACVGGPAVGGATPGKRPVVAKAASGSPKPIATGTGSLGLDGLARVPLPADASVATLTGKVKLIAPAGLISNNGGGIISDNGGGLIAAAKGQIISDNGGGIISNNAGAIISDNGGGLIANNGGGLISDNGGALTSKVKYGLAQAPAALAGFALAEATITFHDATGAVLVDAKGQPLTATTDQSGAYTYNGLLPKGNVVARIRLNPKVGRGDLQAMVARDSAGALTLDLDLASTIGAAYVLGNFVKQDQRVFDKLPRAANEKLQRDLDVVRGYLTGAFAYDARLLTEAADALRTREKAVDATIDEVKALLLGQAAIGAGRKATEVPLIEPMGLFLGRGGQLLLSECFPGRVRTVGPDGTIQTLVDGNFGQIKRNFLKLRDLAEGPDGSLHLLSVRTWQIVKVAPDGSFVPVVGSGKSGRGALGDPTKADVAPNCFVIAPDGTMYIGENHGSGGSAAIPPRVLRLPPGGQLEALPQPSWGTGDVVGVALGPAGEVYAYFDNPGTPGAGEVWRMAPGAPARLAAGLSAGNYGDLVARPDGTLVASEQDGGRIVSIPAGGGAPTVIAGATGPAPTRGLLAPSALALGPDGTLYVADYATTLIHALRPDGRFEPYAGSQAALQDGDVTTFAINGPGGLAFDAEGRLLIGEAGSGTVKRFDGKALAIVAGSTYGLGGDGGPATQARFSAVAGIAFDAGRLWVTDTSNRRIRLVGADGIVSSVAGQAATTKVMEPGRSYDPTQTQIQVMTGLTLAPDGTPYIASGGSHQLLRLVDNGAAGRALEVVAGRDQGDDSNSQAGLIGGLLAGDEPDPAKIALRFPFGLAFDPLAAEPTLYLAEPGGLRVRKLTGLGKGQTPRLQVHAGLSLPDALALAANLGPEQAVPSRNGMKASEAALFLPMGLCFDKAGNLYVTEAGTRSVAAIGPMFGGAFNFDVSGLPQSPARVLRIARDTGLITTICGPEGKWFTDPDAPDALVVPTAIAIAPDGRLVIVDTGANLVRILPAGSF